MVLQNDDCDVVCRRPCLQHHAWAASEGPANAFGSVSYWSASGLAGVVAPATEQARAAVAIDRDDPWSRLALGFSHMLRREHEDAIEELCGG
jgi:hypothetical protein